MIEYTIGHHGVILTLSILYIFSVVYWNIVYEVRLNRAVKRIKAGFKPKTPGGADMSLYFLHLMPPPNKGSFDPYTDYHLEMEKKYKEAVKKPPLTPKAPDMTREDPSLYSKEFNNTPLYTADFNKPKVRPTPKKIKEALDLHIISQDKAKKIIAVAVANHYKRIEYNHFPEVPLRKSNILLIGPTGSGKTLLASSMARELDVPFHAVDISSFTAAGYIGRKVEEIPAGLIESCNSDKTKAAHGIIFIDELDKIAVGNDTHTVNTRRVQQELLKLLEGNEMKVPGHGMFDTSDILFILGGAFEGLAEVIGDRAEKPSIGFTSRVEKADSDKLLLKDLKTTDLIKYGLIPEFLGRLGHVAILEKLDEKALVRILTEPKEAIVKEYKALFSCDKVDLEFSNTALKAIAREAIKSGTGARGLRSIIEKVLLDVMFDLPDNPNVKKITITKDFVEKRLK